MAVRGSAVLAGATVRQTVWAASWLGCPRSVFSGHQCFFPPVRHMTHSGGSGRGQCMVSSGSPVRPHRPSLRISAASLHPKIAPHPRRRIFTIGGKVAQRPALATRSHSALVHLRFVATSWFSIAAAVTGLHHERSSILRRHLAPRPSSAAQAPLFRCMRSECNSPSLGCQFTMNEPVCGFVRGRLTRGYLCTGTR